MAQRTAQQKNATDFDLVLGTAGHIDHGKSSLVLALTGTDPDRLVEEKKRGITIELGFAQLKLPDGRTMGVVDVPGHERFVRHMIAGATVAGRGFLSYRFSPWMSRSSAVLTF